VALQATWSEHGRSPVLYEHTTTFTNDSREGSDTVQARYWSRFRLASLK
jgi:hypothetical protein